MRIGGGAGTRPDDAGIVDQPGGDFMKTYTGRTVPAIAEQNVPRAHITRVCTCLPLHLDGPSQRAERQFTSICLLKSPFPSNPQIIAKSSFCDTLAKQSLSILGMPPTPSIYEREIVLFMAEKIFFAKKIFSAINSTISLSTLL